MSEPEPKPEPVPESVPESISEPESSGRTEVSLFHHAPGVVIHSSNLPGSYATLFSPKNESLVFFPDLSSFSDSAKTYFWAFHYEHPLQPNDRFVFATMDRVRVGLVIDGVIRAMEYPVELKRNAEGQPESVHVKEE